MIKYLVAFFASFFVSLALMPIILAYFKKKKMAQTILGYVENHKNKNGTLTMGGVVFIISSLILVFVFLKFDIVWFFAFLTSLFFGVLGFMDDHIKIKYNQNLGLRPYQKIIGQVGISLIFALFVYYFSNVGSKMFIPFSLNSFDARFFVVPVIILVLLATTNSVNLTDGLDGLAGNVSLFYFIFYVIIINIVAVKMYNLGVTGPFFQDVQSISIVCLIFCGAIMGFLLFNTNKACIFMGDVGSLCLGGLVGTSACVLGFELIIPILGFCFVLSAVSVILQVGMFKWKRKRIFKMAPFHHHLQMSGLTEPKIVQIYSTVTILLGVVCIIFYLA